MEINRRHFIASLGGAAAVNLMSHEARAEAIESYMQDQLNRAASGTKNPTVEEVDALIPTRHYRRGVGSLFVATEPGGKVKTLAPMPDKPTLIDFFNLRFGASANHVFQSANRAMKTGMSEEVVLACLLHDTVQVLIKTDHGYWGAMMYEPYVPEKTAFAIRYHQALRFFDDKEMGYSYPDFYNRIFGENYVPSPHILADYEMVKKHKWYKEARQVTINDLYAFDPNLKLEGINQFVDIIGRHFKQPKEGLGNDGSPVAHMWRTLAMPDNAL